MNIECERGQCPTVPGQLINTQIGVSEFFIINM